ncbi:MAG: hypothetical protein ABEJ69_03700 [Candidatus Nanohaloarchaea archaeon]
MADVTEDGEYIEGDVVRPYDREDETDGDYPLDGNADEDYDFSAEDVELPEKVNQAIETMPHGESHAR